MGGLFSSEMHSSATRIYLSVPLTLGSTTRSTLKCRKQVCLRESASEVTQLCLTLWNPMDCSPQVPLSMGFSRQEYWSGLQFPSPGDLPDPGIEPGSPALPEDSLPSEPPGSPMFVWTKIIWGSLQFHEKLRPCILLIKPSVQFQGNRNVWRYGFHFVLLWGPFDWPRYVHEGWNRCLCAFEIFL